LETERPDIDLERERERDLEPERERRLRLYERERERERDREGVYDLFIQYKVISLYHVLSYIYAKLFK